MGLLDKLQIRTENDTELPEELEPEFAQDPEPGTARNTVRKSNVKSVRQPVRQAPSMAKLTKQVADDLATIIEIGATMWGLTDDCCAPTLEAQAKPISDALVGILGRNPRMLMALAQSDMAVLSVQMIALGKAVAPVGKAVYRNHISKAHDDNDDQERAHDGGIHLGTFPAFSGIQRSANGAG
jgi:hypothetical protein